MPEPEPSTPGYGARKRLGALAAKDSAKDGWQEALRAARTG
jgi:hypothetical protein